MTAVVPRAFQPPDLKPFVADTKNMTLSLYSYCRATRGVNFVTLWLVGIPAVMRFAVVGRAVAAPVALMKPAG